MQKTITKYLLPLPNTKYCTPFTGYCFLFKRTLSRRGTSFHIPSYHGGIYCLRGWSCLLAAKPVMKRGSSQDILYIPSTFHIPLSPSLLPTGLPRLFYLYSTSFPNIFSVSSTIFLYIRAWCIPELINVAVVRMRKISLSLRKILRCVHPN